MQGIVSGILLVAAFAAVTVAAAAAVGAAAAGHPEGRAACLAMLARPRNCTPTSPR